MRRMLILLSKIETRCVSDDKMIFFLDELCLVWQS